MRSLVGKGIRRIVTRESKTSASPRCQVIVFFDDETACEIYGSDVGVASNLDPARRWRERILADPDYRVLADTESPRP